MNIFTNSLKFSFKSFSELFFGNNIKGTITVIVTIILIIQGFWSEELIFFLGGVVLLCAVKFARDREEFINAQFNDSTVNADKEKIHFDIEGSEVIKDSNRYELKFTDFSGIDDGVTGIKIKVTKEIHELHLTYFKEDSFMYAGKMTLEDGATITKEVLNDLIAKIN